MSYHIIIPARYTSVRLPGKPLRMIAGKSLLAHVIESAQRSQAERIIVATDDQRIIDAALDYDVETCLTSAQHNSGTERIHEVIEKFDLADDTVIVNMQGDEPLMPSSCLDQLGLALAQDTGAEMATLSAPMENAEEIFDPNVVKLVCDQQGNALYFSRAPIPWERDAFMHTPPALSSLAHFQRHIGLYAYRAGFVRQYISWGSCELEQIESLEQLRVLYHGEKIKVVAAGEVPGPGVNTEEELQRAEAILLQRQS